MGLGAIMAMALVGLGILLSLILILLAELYCSFLLRRKQNFKKSSSIQTPSRNFNTTAPELQYSEYPRNTPQRSFFAQGVLHAPRSFLFPSTPNVDLEKQIPEDQTRPYSDRFPNCPWLVHEVSPPASVGTSTRHDGGATPRVYICNPIYDSCSSGGIGFCKVETPFETPDTSPSRLETDDGRDYSSSSSDPATPPLTPMKRLPVEASSLSLRVASSLCTTGSDSNSNNDGISSSSSGSPCTSPSW